MTGEEMQHAIEFLLDHHARVSVEIEQLKEAQKEQGANIEKLSETLREGFAETREGFETLPPKCARASTKPARRLTSLSLPMKSLEILRRRPRNLQFTPASE